MLYLKVKSIALHMDKTGYAEFVRLCREHAEASAKDEGNIKFEMKYVRLPFAVKVTFLELWKDRESLNRHAEESAKRGHVALIDSMRSYKETVEREIEVEDIDAIVKGKK